MAEADGAEDGASPRLAGIVLAGGRSRRMGADKCALRLGGRTLIQRVADALGEVADEIAVAGAAGREPPPLRTARPLLRVADAAEGGGPLAGVLAGLEATSAPVAVVVACDLPFVRPALLRLLAERARAGAPFVAPLHEGRPQPLCSAWRRDALPALRERAASGKRAASMLGAPGAVLLPPEAWRAADPAAASFANVNTPADLARARAALARRGDEA